MDKEETSQVLPYLRTFFGIMVKLVQRPATDAVWSQQDKEDYRQFLTEVQTVVGSLALAAGKQVHQWLLEEFETAFAVADIAQRNSVPYHLFIFTEYSTSNV